jgi:hypothetical protein
MDKLSELKESLAKMDEKYKEIKGDMPVDPKMDKYNEVMNYMYDCMSRMRDYMWQTEANIYQRIDNHTNPQGSTHPPMLKTASHVESYLDACGMSNDAEVVKPQIYVRASRQGNKEFDVNLNIK